MSSTARSSPTGSTPTGSTFAGRRTARAATRGSCIVILNEPGTLAEMSGILAANSANITNLRLSNREGGFHTYDVVVEVRDVQHVMRILSALRASDTVVQAERQ